jgi:two-component system chemotaxis response regulator CheY
MFTYRCLIVEDSPMMRQLLEVSLSRIVGLEIDEADDGLAGLKKLASQKYDIVIADINMPFMDGLKLVKHIRNDKMHSDIPIVIVSTEGAKQDVQRAKELGVQAYLSKPISGAEIVSTVKSLLNL